MSDLERAVADGSGTAATSVITSTVPALADELLGSRPGDVYRAAVAIIERPLLAHVLAATGGNQLRAARLLGLNRNTLRKRCRELGLDLPRSPAHAMG
jgi:two-component system, NtrC family, nitrogen regulation response regulator GlnG